MERLFLLLLFLVAMSHSKLSLDLQQTDAVLYSNNEVVLKFKCTGGNGIYNFSFFGIPKDWKISKNDLVITSFSTVGSQEWSFDIHIIDSSKNYLQQTIKIAFSGYQLQIFPITLPKTGVKKPETAKPRKISKIQEFDFEELINRYPGLEGKNQSLFGLDYDDDLEITPHLIASANAIYDPKRDGRKISQYEIKRNAVLQRQINADKAVANLLHIIQKLTANVNAALHDQTIFEKVHNQTKYKAFICQEDLFSLENLRTKILNGIRDKKTKIDQFKIQIQYTEEVFQNLKVNLTSLMRQRLQIQRNDAPNERNLERLQAKLEECDNVLADDKEQIEKIIDQINKNNAQIAIIELQIKESQSRVSELQNDLQLVRKKIENLKNQLKQAQEEEKMILKDQRYFERIPTTGKVKIQTLEQSNRRFEDEIGKINSSIKDAIAECRSFQQQTKDIRQKLAISRMNYEKITKEIEDKQSELNQLRDLIEQLKTTSAKLPIQLFTLQKELEKYEQRIKRQKFVCEVAEEEFLKADQNLKAIIKKYQKNSEYLKEAKLNLEKARSQKELADIAVQELLSSSVSPLPSQFTHSTVPEEETPKKVETQPKPQIKQETEKTSASENNQKSAALEPASELGREFEIGLASQTQKPLFIGNLSQFISKNLKVYLKEPSDKNVLFPIDPKSRQKLVSPASNSAGLSFFSCQMKSKGYIGVVDQVSLGTVKVITNRKKYSLSISACTRIASTNGENFFKKGSTIYFSGRVVFALPGTILFNANEMILVPSES